MPRLRVAEPSNPLTVFLQRWFRLCEGRKNLRMQLQKQILRARRKDCDSKANRVRVSQDAVTLTAVKVLACPTTYFILFSVENLLVSHSRTLRLSVHRLDPPFPNGSIRSSKRVKAQPFNSRQHGVGGPDFAPVGHSCE